jgi:hypothetical protein
MRLTFAKNSGLISAKLYQRHFIVLLSCIYFINKKGAALIKVATPCLQKKLVV